MTFGEGGGCKESGGQVVQCMNMKICISHTITKIHIPHTLTKMCF